MKVGGLVPADEDNFVDEEMKRQDNEKEKWQDDEEEKCQDNEEEKWQDNEEEKCQDNEEEKW